jgi:hypothetical protein
MLPLRQRRSRGRLSALPAAWLSSSGCKTDPNDWDSTDDSQAPMPTSLDPGGILGALFDDSAKPAEPGKTTNSRHPRASHSDESATQASHPKTHQNLITLAFQIKFKI